MGFMWSSPSDPLGQTLIDEKQPNIFRSGDLVITRANELAIVMHHTLWSHVAVVVTVGTKVLAFGDGHFEPLSVYLARRPNSFVRRLECQRPSGFDAQFFASAQKVSDKLLQTTKMNQDTREGYSAFHLLSRMRLTASEYEPSSFRPYHFSSETPFKKIELPDYGPNEPI